MVEVVAAALRYGDTFVIVDIIVAALFFSAAVMII